MIKEVILYINRLLADSGMISKQYGLCELVEKDGKKFPAEYCLNKFIQVSDFDKYKGSCYHRLNGTISISQTDDSDVGCEILSAKTFPVKMVICVKKDLFLNDKNDSYIELSIIENVEALISSQNNSTISSEIDAYSVSIVPTGAIYDRYSIFREEYSNIEMKIPVEYAYISIDYDISIVKKLSCHTQITC